MSVLYEIDNPISTKLAVAFEEASHRRHIEEQRILAGRYHPRHAQQFAENLAFRQLAHEMRVATMRGEVWQPRRRQGVRGLIDRLRGR